MTTQQPAGTVSMTERELALYRAGREMGMATAYAEVARHLEQNAKVAAVQQWSAQMTLWMQALARDVAALRGSGGARGKQHTGKQLADAVMRATPSLLQPQEAIEKFLRDSAQAFAAKGDKSKAQFAAALAAADQVGGQAKGGLKGFVRKVISELDRR